MLNKAKITISLLTYNGAKYLPWLINSLKEQTFKDWELLVLDNASSDGSADIVREHYPQARIVLQKKNIGFARGHNLLINWSKSDYVFVLNQDIILESDYLEKLFNFMEKNPKAASCSGKLMYWNFEEGQKTKQIDSFGLKINRSRHVTNAWQGKEDFDLPNQTVFGLSATAVLYKRKALDIVAMERDNNHLEYFDEDFFSYKEDIDISWRFLLMGYENWLVTDAKAYHHRSVSGQGDQKTIRRQRGLANKLSYRNHFMTLYKNSFFKNLLKDFWHIQWYEFKKFFYLAIFERSTLRGAEEYLKNIPKIAKKRKYIMMHRKVSSDDIYKWFTK
ncbi:glycosyltransferase family 2 protein [Candidatus Parcubacteria bacterium]|nr:MAG: glycosyltransferase family 2 protein [Candidatus Parcubacteria bacterium]